MCKSSSKAAIPWSYSWDRFRWQIRHPLSSRSLQQTTLALLMESNEIRLGVSFQIITRCSKLFTVQFKFYLSRIEQNVQSFLNYKGFICKFRNHSPSQKITKKEPYVCRLSKLCKPLIVLKIKINWWVRGRLKSWCCDCETLFLQTSNDKILSE